MRFPEPPELKDVPADYVPIMGDAVKIDGVLHAWVPGMGWCNNDAVFHVQTENTGNIVITIPKEIER